jgi:Ecdysteroid kinase-like family
MSEVEVSDYIKKSFEIVVANEKFKNYEVFYNQGAGVGDGYVGSILKATIKDKDSDRELTLLAKIPPRDKQMRKQMNSMQLFQREVYVYSVVIPEFIKMQEEKNISKSDGFYNFPKVYYANFDKEHDEAIIVMEDLRETGHKMWNKFEPMNFDHASLLMKTLGRLHAISFAMKSQKPEQFKKFRKLNDLFPFLFNIDNLEEYLQTLVKDAIETLNTEQQISASKLVDEIRQVFLETCSTDWSEPFSMVIHGDCWSNNFLYCYGDDGLPCGIRLLDWQFTRYCSPVTDLLYFFFICTDGDFRYSHFDELIKLYHTSVKEMLKNLDYNSKCQFDYSTLIEHLQKVGKYGIVMATMVTSLVHVADSDLIELALADRKNNLPFDFEKQIRLGRSVNKEKTIKKIREMLIDAHNNGYLSSSYKDC